MLRTTIASALCIAALGAVACSAHSGDSSTADENEAAASSAQATHLGNIAFGSITSQDPPTAAGQVQAATQLWPAGCVTRVKDATNPNVVHLTFNDCTGPFGLLHINGQVTITFSANTDGSLHAAWAGSNMTVNGRPATFSSSADITVSGTTRSVAWQGAWTRVGFEGDTVSHTSNLSISVDSAAQCRTASGSTVTDVATREVDTTVSNYKICFVNGVEECPTGTLTHVHKTTGKTVTVNFDGTNEATITGPNGGVVKVPLVCGS